MPGLARRLAAHLALCMLAGTLAACAGSGGASQELKTASDQTTAEKRSAIRLQLAIGYFQDGKLDVALDEVKKALAADPDSADAYGVRALIYSGMGERALAEDNYQRALKLAPGNPELGNNYGSFLCQTGRAEQGIGYFEAALKNPTYQSPLKALLNAASCSLKIKKFEQAERYLLDALRVDPDLPTTNASLARVYYERRDYTRAGFFINRLKAAAKLDTLSADVLWLAIRVERKLGNKASEASLVTQLVQRHPGSPEHAAFQRGAYDE